MTGLTLGSQGLKGAMAAQAPLCALIAANTSVVRAVSPERDRRV